MSYFHIAVLGHLETELPVHGTSEDRDLQCFIFCFAKKKRHVFSHSMHTDTSLGKSKTQTYAQRNERIHDLLYFLDIMICVSPLRHTYVCTYMNAQMYTCSRMHVLKQDSWPPIKTTNIKQTNKQKKKTTAIKVICHPDLHSSFLCHSSLQLLQMWTVAVKAFPAGLWEYCQQITVKVRVKNRLGICQTDANFTFPDNLIDTTEHFFVPFFFFFSFF